MFSAGSGSKMASFGNFAAGGSAALTRLALRHWRGRVYWSATWESGVLSATRITTRVGEIRGVGGLVRWKERKYWSEIAVIPFQRADLILCRGEGRAGQELARKEGRHHSPQRFGKRVAPGIAVASQPVCKHRPMREVSG